MDRALEWRTLEVLALTALNRTVDQQWVDWALEMMVAGDDSPGLVRLAGESQPFNAFEMDALVRRVFQELGLSIPVDRSGAAVQLASVLVRRFLSGESPMDETMQRLSHLYIEAGFIPELYVFYLMALLSKLAAPHRWDPCNH